MLSFFLSFRKSEPKYNQQQQQQKIISEGVSVRFEFYRDTYERDKASSESLEQKSGKNKQQQLKKSQQQESKQKAPKQARTDQGTESNGSTVIQVSNVAKEAKEKFSGDLYSLFCSLVAQHNVPEKFYSSLWTRLRLANNFESCTERQTWAEISLTSLSIISRGNMTGQSEDIKLYFSHFPDLIEELASILRIKDKAKISREIIEATLKSLISISTRPSRVHEVAAILLSTENPYNALLPTLVREAVDILVSKSPEVKALYDYEELLNLIIVISTTNPQNQAIQDSGMLSDSLSILDIRRPGYEKIISKYLSLLELLIQAQYPNIIQLLENGGSIKILSLLNDAVADLQSQVDQHIASMSEGSSQAREPKGKLLSEFIL